MSAHGFMRRLLLSLAMLAPPAFCAEADFAHYRPHLAALLRGGVIAVRDMAGDDRLRGYLAGEAYPDALPSPDIFYVALMAGPSFFAEDRRAQAASVGESLGHAPWMQAIDHATDLPLAVAEAKGTGATALKLYANLPADLVVLTADPTRDIHNTGKIAFVIKNGRIRTS